MEYVLYQSQPLICGPGFDLFDNDSIWYLFHGLHILTSDGVILNIIIHRTLTLLNDSNRLCWTYLHTHRTPRTQQRING